MNRQKAFTPIRSPLYRNPVNMKGFTLIELLVVISIIAVLSAVGFVSFQGIRAKSLDSKRKADIDAIKKAYEVKYDPTLNGGQGGYRALEDRDFANGKIPTPDDGSANNSYFLSGPNTTGVTADTNGYAACATVGGSNYCATSTQGQGASLLVGTQVAPGSSCKDILAKKAGIPDGLYWIKPSSADAFQAYCDMTTDGGGWTLLMKSDGNNNTFTYSANYWTSANTLNPSNPDPVTNGEAKYDTFNILPITEVRATWPTISNYKIQETLSSSTTALSRFQTFQDLSGTNAFAQFNTTAFPQQTGYKQYGFNLTCAGHARVRWGWAMNNEGTCNTNDVSAGIGMSYDASRMASMGGWATCCSANGKVVGPYPFKVRIWGR